MPKSQLLLVVFFQSFVCNSGIPVIDQVVTILLSTHMFVGGFLGFFLDNTIPGECTEKVGSISMCATPAALLGNYSFLLYQGTRQERGFVWEKEEHAEFSKTPASDKLYDLPLGITTFFSSYSWVRFIPFCPWEGENSDEASVVQHQPGEDLCDGAFDPNPPANTKL